MMNIAIPTDGKNVSEHFGHCPLFYFVTVEDGKIVRKKFIENPGHQPGFLPRFLNEQGANCVLAGGMGTRAIDLFRENDIEVVTGVTGSLEQVIDQYINGDLITDGNICDH